MQTPPRLAFLLVTAFVALPALAACQDRSAEGEVDRPPRGTLVAIPAPVPVDAAPLPGASAGEVARAAWTFIERNWQERTGLVRATDHYVVITSWDTGSILAALYSAHGLGLIDEAEYDRRMARTLATLETVPLYDDIAFNKAYNSATGRMVDRRDRPSDQGYGWSVLDMGRILSWLKIVEQGTPRHGPAARRVVERLDFDHMVEDGYLVGGNLQRGRTVTYVEGRVGYEQYAAEAFARWGRSAPRSADLSRNTRPVEVLGEVIYADTRGRERLTSDPLIMLGLELGWSAEMRRLAQSVLRAQRARHEATGIVTIVNEDAMTEPPHYFYYYVLHQDGRDFVVDAQGARGPLDGPRWVSAKAAHGWHSLLPDDYTALAVETVAPALASDRGWFSGVYEANGQRAGSLNINTAGVILSAMLFRETGLPLIGAGR